MASTARQRLARATEHRRRAILRKHLLTPSKADMRLLRSNSTASLDMTTSNTTSSPTSKTKDMEPMARLPTVVSKTASRLPISMVSK